MKRKKSYFYLGDIFAPGCCEQKKVGLNIISSVSVKVSKIDSIKESDVKNY